MRVWLLLMTDGSLKSIPLTEVQNEGYGIVDQYDHVCETASASSVEELKELGLYDEVANTMAEHYGASLEMLDL